MAFALIFVFDNAKQRTHRTWQLARVLAAALNLGAAVVVLMPLAIIAAGICVGFVTGHPTIGLICVGILVGGVAPIVTLGVLMPSLLARFARGYRWSLAEYTLELDPSAPAEQVFRLRLKVAAVRPNVAIVENRYRWSGAGPQPTPMIERGAQAILGPTPVGTWQYYYIHFGKGLPINGEHEVVLRQDFQDVGGDFQPFFAKTVIEPIETLILRVKFTSTAPGDVWATAGYPPPTATRENDITDTLAIDSNGEARLEIRNVKHNWRYCIGWSPRVH